ncbi:MAG: ribbon-helix-helix domain-containing protein [Candidatus Melainabacteria bacterium]|nr:MAG: ribbon-helix-helix domain-containing protein [Candidatus Melainabacteria bacterium]
MTTTIRLSPEIEQRLDLLSQRTGRSKSFYIREMIEGNIDALEDYYLAAETLERIRSGKEKTHNAAEVRKQLGLAD